MSQIVEKHLVGTYSNQAKDHNNKNTGVVNSAGHHRRVKTTDVNKWTDTKLSIIPKGTDPNKA